ncbi:PepSY domain-containing protein [Micromonospora sp. NPDC048909]|uniref:PepSY domain-containing protein n=1 Tax=Micromonospora sp. NPDC048909 TaxID=3155643 RepID=UPI0033D240F3
MKRSAMILTTAGAAVLAVAGVALGVSAADGQRAQGTTLAAATTAPGTPDDSTTSATPDDSSSATPDDSASAGAPGSPSGAPTTSAAPGQSTGPATGDRIDPQRAGEIALARAGGGRIVEVEAEQEHGRPVWSVEIVAGGTEHDIDVDRDSGAVLRAEQEPADDDDADDNDDKHDDDDDHGDDDDDDDDHGDDD